MADEWFEQYITKELELAEMEFGNLKSKPQLTEIIKEGFTDTGKTSGYLKIYAKEDDVIFYDKYKDRKACEFNLQDLMGKL